PENSGYGGAGLSLDGRHSSSRHECFMTTDAVRPATQHRQAPYQLLYIQVLFAILLGVVIGWLKPDLGKELKPLGDGFIVLIKMMIAPVIFAPSFTASPRW